MSAATSNQTRISKRFAALRESGELGIVAYITAGDPSLDATHKFVLALAQAGADVIELGIPFSDPLADGPTIQRASERALKTHTTLAQVIDLVRDIRKSSEVPIVLFGYYNPVLQMGLEKFAATAASAGADGALITDLTPEESNDYRQIRRRLFRFSLPNLSHRRDRREERSPRRSSRPLAPRSQSHPTSHRRGLRHLASWPRLRSRRPGRCRRSRLRPRFRN